MTRCFAIVFLVVACWAAAGLLLAGCRASKSIPTQSRIEAAAPVTLPAKAAQESAATAGDSIKAADDKAASLQTAATTRPAIPSPEVTAAATAIRFDLAAAARYIADAAKYAGEAFKAGIQQGAKMAEIGKERDDAKREAVEAKRGEHKAWVYGGSIVFGLLVAWGVYELGTGLVAALLVGAGVSMLIPFVVDDVRWWLKWLVPAGIGVGLLLLFEAKHKGGIKAAILDRWGPKAVTK